MCLTASRGLVICRPSSAQFRTASRREVAGDAMRVSLLSHFFDASCPADVSTLMLAQGRQAAAGPVQSSLRSRPTQSSPQTVQEHTTFTLRAVPSLYRSGGGLARSLGTVGGIHSKLSEVVLFDCACRLDQNTWASEYEVDWSSNFGFGGSAEVEFACAYVL